MGIYSFSPFGYEGSLVSVEVDLRRGIPAIDIVGLADGTVKESRERMRSAILNSGFDFPPERVLISLSPADLKKEGAGFDLALALAVLQAKEECCGEKILVMGELELNGKIRPVKGIHAAVSTALSKGINFCIVPKANEREALEVRGMNVFGALSLKDAFEALEKKDLFVCLKESPSDMLLSGIPQDAVCLDGVYFLAENAEEDFSLVKNQGFLIRALQIAAAGGHNLLAYGPPGCGKTLSLQKFPQLLPLLSFEDAASLTRIYSIAGLLPAVTPLLRIPPFRQPHQTATIEGMCGGGPKCLPGEISLAHKGVLFLDEAAEFKSSVLQMLRVPLEGGSITLSRAGRSTCYPADFQLLMATNPCPCGFYGSQDKICLCSARSIEQYWKKFSGPLLDRVDLRVHVGGHSEDGQCFSTSQLRKSIALAVSRERKRQGKLNSNLSPLEIEEFCKSDGEAGIILQSACEKYDFSPRARASVLKTARTIADMSGLDKIDASSMAEAVGYRKNQGDWL